MYDISFFNFYNKFIIIYRTNLAETLLMEFFIYEILNPTLSVAISPTRSITKSCLTKPIIPNVTSKSRRIVKMTE